MTFAFQLQLRRVAFRVEQLQKAALRSLNPFKSRSPKIALLTDFGTGDEAIYAIKSAVHYVAPSGRVDDICHNVPPGNVLVGAWRLNRAVNLKTESDNTVYVAVVDPGVGTDRKCIAVLTKKGKYLVGPDNGVLSLAFQSEGIKRAVEIADPRFTLLRFAQSRTFHGKDVFGPVAAYLASGVPLEDLGPILVPATLKAIDLSGTTVSDERRSGYLVDVDGFGSLRTTIPNHVPEIFLGKDLTCTIRDNDGADGSKDAAEVNLGRAIYQGQIRLVGTFGEALDGECIAIQSSTGCFDIAVNNGRADQEFGIAINNIKLDSGGNNRPGKLVDFQFT